MDLVRFQAMSIVHGSQHGRGHTELIHHDVCHCVATLEHGLVWVFCVY
jgi:hypothetical protein